MVWDDILGGPVLKAPEFLPQGAQIWSLVREIPNATQNSQKQNKQKQMVWEIE